MTTEHPWLTTTTLPSDGQTVWFWRQLTNGVWGMGEGTYKASWGVFVDVITYPIACVSHWKPRYVEPRPAPPEAT